ncbi:MAG TPA: hypothetical protein VGD59_02590 [Acidisarcina sp.]
MDSPTRPGSPVSLAVPAAPSIADVYAAFEALNRCVGVEAEGVAIDAASGPGPGGRLVLYAPTDASGAAVALASSIAGAASLGLDADEERLKLALRRGVCDFVVNGLDEALRILKNEVRKRQPVAVGLVCDVPACLQEMVERGVQPDVVACPRAGLDSAFELFVARGAVKLPEWSTAGPAAAGLREEVWWSAAESAARWLPQVDALAVEAIAGRPGEPDPRLRWLRVAARYLGRVPEHYVRMSTAEAERLIEAVASGIASGSLSAGVAVRRGRVAASSLAESLNL